MRGLQFRDQQQEASPVFEVCMAMQSSNRYTSYNVSGELYGFVRLYRPDSLTDFETSPHTVALKIGKSFLQC